MSDSELVVVHTFGNRQEADLAVGALDAAGIDAIVRSDDAGGLRPALAFVNGVALLVRAEDVEEARAILERPAKA